MHPEIKKFWQEAGYRITNEEQVLSGVVSGIQQMSASIGRIDTLAFGDRHRFNGVWYSEEQMLRIIRLKAFL